MATISSYPEPTPSAPGDQEHGNITKLNLDKPSEPKLDKVGMAPSSTTFDPGDRAASIVSPVPSQDEVKANATSRSTTPDQDALDSILQRIDTCLDDGKNSRGEFKIDLADLTEVSSKTTSNGVHPKDLTIALSLALGCMCLVGVAFLLPKSQHDKARQDPRQVDQQFLARGNAAIRGTDPQALLMVMLDLEMRKLDREAMLMMLLRLNEISPSQDAQRLLQSYVNACRESFIRMQPHESRALEKAQNFLATRNASDIDRNPDMMPIFNEPVVKPSIPQTAPSRNQVHDTSFTLGSP
jgi:hypothetical protein